jgi:hypothetical protein
MIQLLSKLKQRGLASILVLLILAVAVVPLHRRYACRYNPHLLLLLLCHPGMLPLLLLWQRLLLLRSMHLLWCHFMRRLLQLCRVLHVVPRRHWVGMLRLLLLVRQSRSR